MKTLTELIQNYQNGIPNSDSEILKRMEPLVKDMHPGFTAWNAKIPHRNCILLC